MMHDLFKIQLDNTNPLTFKDYERLEETEFHVGNDPVLLNLKYKYYYSGREKQVGDIVLCAVLAYYEKNELGRTEVIIQTITLHPDEIENYEDFDVLPTKNETLLPVITFKSKKEDPKNNLEEILSKVLKDGMKSLTSDELELFKKINQN